MVGRFQIPGHAIRREYAVYVVAARNHSTKNISFYIGKTGDNREGCNPVISRAGNHFSYNKIHSQMRNHLHPKDPTEYDYDYFYVTFGAYTEDESENRNLVDVTNEMERSLNQLVQKRLKDVGDVLNPFKGNGWVPADELARRESYRTSSRVNMLNDLIDAVREWAKLGLKAS